MVEYRSEQLNAAFRALGDPTRRAMLQQLAGGECSIGELAEPFHMSFAGASKHVRVLEDAGLIERSVQGRIHMCRLRAQPLAAIDEWLRFYEIFWNSRLDALDRELQREPKKPAKGDKRK